MLYAYVSPILSLGQQGRPSELEKRFKNGTEVSGVVIHTCNLSGREAEREEDCYMFKISLLYKVSPKLERAT